MLVERIAGDRLWDPPRVGVMQRGRSRWWGVAAGVFGSIALVWFLALELRMWAAGWDDNCTLVTGFPPQAVCAGEAGVELLHARWTGPALVAVVVVAIVCFLVGAWQRREEPDGEGPAG